MTCQSVCFLQDDVPVDVGHDKIESCGWVQRFQGAVKHPQPLTHPVEGGVPVAGPGGVGIDVESNGASCAE